MSRISPKTKVRRILEKLGYEYTVIERDTKLGLYKFRYMINNSGSIHKTFRIMELEPNKEVVWAICAMCSDQIPGFIDLVYPFPFSQFKIIDTIYSFYYPKD